MPGFSSIALDRRSTAEQIAIGLSRLVLSGELAPGLPLKESAIATDLGVSRNTVREAVRIVERSGLVRYELNRGAVVREPSADDLQDVYQARLAIELGAVYTMPDDAMTDTTLTAALDALRTEAEKGVLEGTISADLDFHAALVAAAGSARLSDAYAPVLNELRLYLTILSVRDAEFEDPERLIAEHLLIADAFVVGDREGLAKEVINHCAANRDRVAQILDEKAAGEAASASRSTAT
ncbi:MAG TPA: GntR family transcriptional regulator [Solirubrobacter sp.]|nr:GntR family transcriptional regulator [Solirubrobacter sp.]